MCVGEICRSPLKSPLLNHLIPPPLPPFLLLLNIIVKEILEWFDSDQYAFCAPFILGQAFTRPPPL